MKQWSPPNGYLSEFILEQFLNGYRGHAIDVGASDGMSVNTTFALEKSHHWTVVSVEPNPRYHPWLLQTRAMVERCACDNQSGEATFHVYKPHEEAYSALRPNRKKADQPGPWESITVKVKTLDEILARWEFPKLDALCIDTEGTELDVLKGCDLKEWLPKVIIVEAWEQGALDEYLKPFGYGRVGRSVDNDLYTRP